MKSFWRSLVALTLLIGTVALVAACGSSDGGNDSGDAEQPSENAAAGVEGNDSSGKQAAQKFVAEHSDLKNLDWPTPPDKPYDPGSGKIGIVMCGIASGCVEMGKEAVKAAKAAGWEATEPLDGEFTPSVQNGLVQQLVAEEVDAIFLISIQPEQIAAAINAAVEAGIPISCAYCQEGPQFKSFGGPVTMVTQNGVTDGEFLGTYIAAHAEGETRVDVVGDDPGFPIVVERTDGVENALEEYCQQCDLHVTKMSGAELAEPGPPAFSALLASNPPGSLEWVVGGPSDPLGEPMLKTAEQQGRTDIKWVGIDSGPAVLENLAEGGIVEVDTLAGYRYAAWAAVEEAIRQVAGLQPWKADELPIAYITEENVSEATSDLPKYYAPPSFDYEKIYSELWSGK